MLSPARQNPEYGRGTHTLEDEPDEGEAAQLAAWLDDFLSTPGLVLPRPPTVALEIHELSRRPDSDIGKIAQLLAREPVLAARVLKLANSPLYRGEAPSTTLKQALTRVGLSAARDIVMEAALRMTIIRADGMNKTLERVRRHSSGVAWISRAVARNTPLEAENAFLVGLLHDIGLSIGLVGAAEFLRLHKRPVRLTAARWFAVDQAHQALGQKVLEQWGVGPAMAFTIGHHHCLMVDGRPHPGVAVLTIAEDIVLHHGWETSPLTDSDDDAPMGTGLDSVDMDETERALNALSLTRRHYELLKKDATLLLETLGGQFKE
jgi:HD-like signal output (HDOD) protein